MNEMSRCVCCNEKFYPNIITDENNRFLMFEDMCANCVSESYLEEVYDEVFDNMRVKTLDEFLLFHTDLFTDSDTSYK